ncbi:ubiquitin-conjugating enzyme E2, partial [bacterium]|nr:ubiquitin-conjugating enzyme E2 [bacterium]
LDMEVVSEDVRVGTLAASSAAGSSGGGNSGDNVGDGGGGESANKKKSVVLPKPFHTFGMKKLGDDDDDDNVDPQIIRRQLIQQTMKDDNLSSVEKQKRIQELMRIGDGGIVGWKKAADAADEDGAANAAHEEDDDDEMAVEEGNEDGGHVVSKLLKNDTLGGRDKNQPPPAAAAVKPPPSINKNLNTATTIVTTTTRNKLPTPPSNEWIQFIQCTPRCAGAENIRNTSVFYNSHTSSSAMTSSELAVPPKCLKRLFKELHGLENDLPSDPHCSIWLRFDDETPQYIRALITGPLPGPTPYSGGVFAFDIYIPNDYPHTNPKVQLLITGGGRVRFGPNLYADGKVCLSLLGTWSGPKWNSKHSSLYQVLISIQGLILGVGKLVVVTSIYNIQQSTVW